jgi:hypothetical protein
VPAGQGEQIELQDAPTVAEYVPTEQRVHAAFEEAPAAEEYVPAGHGVGLTEKGGQ